MSNVLLGGAIGDALGVPFESKPASNPLLLSWDQKSYLGSEHHKLQPGQFSDDTQFSQTIAQSLVERGGFDPDDLSKRYVELFVSSTIRGYGKTSLLAVQNLINGKHWSESGVAGSYGNGTAMRAAPFGIFYRDDIKRLVEVATIDAQITHASDEAIAGSISIALAAAYAVNNDTSNLVEKILPYLPDSSVKKALYSLSALTDSSHIQPAIALRVIGTKADVRETTAAALYCFLRFSSYQEAVITAIMAGGDTDTTAAIVGALFGAKNSSKDIPFAWSDQIEDRDKLVVMDSQLYNRGSSLYTKV